MSFLMDYVPVDQQPTGDSLLGRSYNNGDGIELADIGHSGISEEELPNSRLHRDRRGRLMAIGASLMLVVMLLGGMSAASQDSDVSSNTSTSKVPKYMSAVDTATTAVNAVTAKPVAGKPMFKKPNSTQIENQENAFLPQYTVQELIKSPYSAQAKALQWLENYPHFRAVRKWRKRQLMALATFYYSTGGDSHWSMDAKRDWLTNTVHECNWQGDVLFNPECSKKGYKGRYQKMELGFNTLKGSLPPELCMLTDLKYLELYGNDFLEGSIPTQYGRFGAMTDLSLYNNQLNGPLPSQLGRMSRLTIMNLDHNALTGTIPSELGMMSSIERLHLSDNQLTGEIPSVLKQLTNLKSLFLQGNSFNGTVSPSLCYFPQLEEIWVDCESVKCPCSECMCSESGAPIDDFIASKEEEQKVQQGKQLKAKHDANEAQGLHSASSLSGEGKGNYELYQPSKYPPPNDP